MAGSGIAPSGAETAADRPAATGAAATMASVTSAAIPIRDVNAGNLERTDLAGYSEGPRKARKTTGTAAAIR